MKQTIVCWLFFYFVTNLDDCECNKRVKRIVGGITAAAPPVDDPVVFVRFVGRYARVEGTRSRETGLYAFRGIRYADAPVGQNRFQRPRFLRLEGDVNAINNGPACPQPDPNYPHRVIGSEDCLLLNIFTPKMPDETTGLPVLLWIHGGGFRYGSAAQYGAEPLTQNDVIFVPVQYRLGTLGVMGDGTKDFSGNLAMLDMTCALRWITEYISFFGGDPKQIKVVGHGSGAQSAMYLSTSQMPRSSISGVVAMSGSSLSQYSYDKEPTTSVKEIAEKNNCSTLNETETVECMRKKSVDDLVINDSELQTDRLAGKNMVKALTGNAGMSPVIENEDDYRGLPGVITESPNETLKKARFQSIPLLIGVTKDETANGIEVKEIESIFSSSTKFLHDTSQMIGLEGFLTNNQSMDLFGINLDLLTYLQIPKSWSPEKVLSKLVEATTDALFNLPAVVTAQAWSKVADTYLYSFEHKGSNSKGSHFLKGLPLVSKSENKEAVAHGDELGFLFDTFDVLGNPVPGSGIKTDSDRKAREAFLKLITKFAYLNVTKEKDGNIFKSFSSKGTPYFKIGQQIEVKNDFRFCQMKIWGAKLEALKSFSCKFLGDGLQGIKNVVSGVIPNLLNSGVPNLG